ncbi:MAG: glycosyltransferase [Anaerolineales bacterium]
MPEPAAGLVSVIVPVFNGARYLGQALDSILAQDYNSLELIVVDDGSTDDSPRIARACPPARLISQSNQGCGAAKNTGLAAASGEFLAFLDADDIWLPGKLSLQVAALRRNPQAGLTTGRMRLFLEPGVERPAWVPPAFLDEPQIAYLPSGLLIRRATFDQIGIFDPTFLNINDFEWLARARDVGVLDIVTPEVVLLRRVHDANISHRADERSRELLRIMRTTLARKGHALAGAPSK